MTYVGRASTAVCVQVPTRTGTGTKVPGRGHGTGPGEAHQSVKKLPENDVEHSSGDGYDPKQTDHRPMCNIRRTGRHGTGAFTHRTVLGKVFEHRTDPSQSKKKTAGTRLAMSSCGLRARIALSSLRLLKHYRVHRSGFCSLVACPGRNI